MLELNRQKPAPTLFKASRGRNTHSTRHPSKQEIVVRLAELALAQTDLVELLAQSSELLVGAVSADLCLIYELVPEQGRLVLKSHTSLPRKLSPPQEVGLDAGSLPGYTLLVNQAVRAGNLGAEERFSESWLSSRAKASSGASVVIPGADHPWGVLCVYTLSQHDFKPSHTNFLQTAARLLGSAAERYRAEQILRLARDQFAHIVEGVAEAITVQKPNGELVYSNLAAARLLGYSSAEELMNTPVREITQRFQIYGEDGQEFAVENLPGRLALQGIPDASATLRFRILATGIEHWSIVSARPIFDASGQVVLAVNIFRDISDLKRKELYQKLLAEAGNVLSASLDYPTTLANVAQLAVTNLADWCTVHIVDEGQTPRQLVVAHVDPQKVELALETQQKYPPNLDARTGVGNVIRTGKAEFYPYISDDMIAASARDAEHLRQLKELGLRSAIINPLIARGKTLGAISLIWAESGRSYTKEDVELIEELARRAAIAVDNARLYHQAQQLNEELERRVTRRTEKLQEMVAKLRNEIGERQRVEQDLRRTESLLANLFESAPDAVILIDMEGRIVRMNQQGEKLFGYTRQELRGKSIDILLPVHSRSRHNSLREAYFKDMRIRPMGIDLELYARRKDSQEFPVEIMLSPVNTQEGSFVISAVRDVTERKKLQAELAEVHRMLIENVEAERLYLSRELHDGPIQDLYGISLELAQLNRIIQDESIFEQVNSAVNGVKEVVADLREICGDLRPPALTPFGLEKAIRTHAESFVKNQPDLQVKLSLAVDKQEIDERIRLALFRVYQNAMSNAVRHARAKSIEIRFSYDSEQVVLEVQDDGQGFVLPQRWVELARQGHFGLVGSAERVEAIGGHLEVITAPGQGTLIRAAVPRQRQADTSPSRTGRVGV